MHRLSLHQFAPRPKIGSHISTPLLWMPRSAFAKPWATTLPSNKRIESKVHRRTRPMALDHLLILVEPSDCGRKGMDELWEQALG